MDEDNLMKLSELIALHNRIISELWGHLQFHTKVHYVDWFDHLFQCTKWFENENCQTLVRDCMN